MIDYVKGGARMNETRMYQFIKDRISLYKDILSNTSENDSSQFIRAIVTELEFMLKEWDRLDGKDIEEMHNEN